MWSTLDVGLAVALAAMLAFWVGASFGDYCCKRDNREAVKAGVFLCDGEGFYLIKQNRHPGQEGGK